jgi:cysteine desulfurase / selenocysteine lyase
VNSAARNYLDNAATSWPKPDAVYVAMDRFSRETGSTAGRGSYRSATQASEVVASCRRQLMRVIHASQASEIAFFSNGTTALNAAIMGVVQPGDHVVTTAIEHNSVLRPLAHLNERGMIRLTIARCSAKGEVDIDQLLEAIEPNTALVAIAHASNVTGSVQDVATIGKSLQDHKALLLCDAAQTLGYLSIDVQEMGIDLLAAPGHKGSCGPLGTGMLYASPKATRVLRPTIFGGTGSVSESLEMPSHMPEMLEAGNLNVAAIAGWDAGLQYLLSQPPTELDGHRQTLCRRMIEKLGEIPGAFALIGAEIPVASIVFDQLEPSLVASLLDSEYAIEVRSGFHCAALIHAPIRDARAARTNGQGPAYQGTLRFSGSHLTSPEQIDEAAAAVNDLVAELAES